MLKTTPAAHKNWKNALVVIASLYSIVMKVISGWWALCNVNLLYSNVLYGGQEINTKLLIIYCGERRSKYKLLRLSVFQISTTKRIYILKLARTNLGFENSVLKCHRTDNLFLIIFFPKKYLILMMSSWSWYARRWRKDISFLSYLSNRYVMHQSRIPINHDAHRKLIVQSLNDFLIFEPVFKMKELFNDMNKMKRIIQFNFQSLVCEICQNNNFCKRIIATWIGNETTSHLIWALYSVFTYD